MKIAFYASSILSSYWNGAATYYRGIVRELAALGHDVTFYEPDAFDRQRHRDIDPPDWCRVRVWPDSVEAAKAAAAEARMADVVVKASGVGVHDDLLLDAVMAAAAPAAVRIWWDVDAPATLAALEAGGEATLRRHLPHLDAVLTYGGGPGVTDDYRSLGAPVARAVYNAADIETHHPVPADARFAADLAFLGNRLPDREARVDAFFLEPARRAPERRFLLGGAGWETAALPGNVAHIGHVPTADHNAFNTTPLAVLNVNRASMAARGFSPPTRIFEAAAAGACIVTDSWPGIDMFLEPGREILVARDGDDVLRHLSSLGTDRARAIGDAARRRIVAEHTYARRAREVDALLHELAARRRRESAA